jgi:hypothetical protein
MVAGNYNVFSLTRSNTLRPIDLVFLFCLKISDRASIFLGMTDEG